MGAVMTILTLPEIEAMRLRWASTPATPWPTQAEGLSLAETAADALDRLERAESANRAAARRTAVAEGALQGVCDAAGMGRGHVLSMPRYDSTLGAALAIDWGIAIGRRI